MNGPVSPEDRRLYVLLMAGLLVLVMGCYVVLAVLDEQPPPDAFGNAASALLGAFIVLAARAR